MRISSVLHDVGKIGIEDRILRKPGALTNQEFDVMKTHPPKGADILQSIPQMAEMIHAHPTLAEGLMEAAEDVEGKAIHQARKKDVARPNVIKSEDVGHST